MYTVFPVLNKFGKIPAALCWLSSASSELVLYTMCTPEGPRVAPLACKSVCITAPLIRLSV